MSSQVIADFQAEMYADEAPYDEPTDGRLVMNREQLVAAFPERTVRVDQSDVFDVVVKQPPADIEFIDTVLTIAYRRLGDTLTLFIGAGPDTIETFRQVLFKSLLVGTRVRIQHPAQVGGRVTDVLPRGAVLGVAPEALEFRHEDGTDAIRLADVTDFERRKRQFGPGSEAIPSIGIQQFTDGRAGTSFVGSTDQRSLNLVGRYLRIEYAELRADIADIDLDEAGVEILVTLYSGGSAADLARTLGVEPHEIDARLTRLEESELVEPTSDGYELTDRGRIIVNERLESVNR